MQNEIAIVVPCYNEAKRLNVRAFSDFIAGHQHVALVFVDDGSTDDTPLILERLRQLHSLQVCTLRLGTNVGKAEAVRRGIFNALRRRPAMVGYWDADLATPLESILRFADVLRSRPNIELVMGSRVALLGREIRRKGMRHFAGRVFATVASSVLRIPVYDTQCGAKLFRVTPALHEIMSRPFRSRWIFDVEILARMLASPQLTEDVRANEGIYEYPLEKWCDIENTRLKPIDFLIAVMDLAAIYRQYRSRVHAPQVKIAGVQSEIGPHLKDAHSRHAA